MRIALVSDAWAPQVNGVVRTFQNLQHELDQRGIEVVPIVPSQYRTLPLPTYPEIRLALAPPGAVGRRLGEVDPEHIHIATEGPLGILARRWCLKKRRSFTTSFHTRFPEYVSARLPIPEGPIYRWLARFHNAGTCCMVATASLARELDARGFAHICRWSRGVDTDLYRPREHAILDLPRPVFLYVGRVAVEKNIEAFLKLDLPGTKLVVGDGPARETLISRFPDAVFVGSKVGEELAAHYASADVFVFPSLTDTFGVVLLEALASGLPVAAYPVTGPLDVIGDSGVGVLDDDLGAAALAALDISGDRCRDYAMTYTWAQSADMFLANITTSYTDECPEPG